MSNPSKNYVILSNGFVTPALIVRRFLATPGLVSVHADFIMALILIAV